MADISHLENEWRSNSMTYLSGAGQNTLRRLALFLYLNHPTTNDVTSGKNRSKIGAALVSVELKSEVSVECDFFVFVNQHFHGILL